MKKEQQLSSGIFDSINTILMILVFVIMTYPFLYIINLSFSDSLKAKGGLMLWPNGFSLQSYQACFSNSDTLNGTVYIQCKINHWIGFNNFCNLYGGFCSYKKKSSRYKICQ